MGNLSDGMQTLVDAIRASTESRHKAVSELRSDTHNLLERYDLGHRDMAQALRKRLAVAHSELCSDTHNLLERYDLGHRDMAQALRDRLSAAHGELRSDTHKMRDEVASDLGRARQIWGGLKKKIAPESVPEEAISKVAPAEVEEKVPVEVEEKPAAEAALPPDEKRVLKVIGRHPRGVKLVDIGNELGVDWRTLIGSVKSLVDGDWVEKIETLYYPKGKGPEEEI